MSNNHPLNIAFPTIGTVVNVRQNHPIYAECQPADTLFKIVSGMARTCKFKSTGQRQIDAFHTRGDVFGFEADSFYSISAEAVSDCTLISYSRSGLAALSLNHQNLATELYTHCIRNLIRARDHAYRLGQSSAITKLASFLIEESERSANPTHITLVMTRTDIADYLGLSVETVSRTLTQLRKTHLIKFSYAREINLTDLNGLRWLND
jgi:CRP/FNR family nitrogen fixation transcriptional regulator